MCLIIDRPASVAINAQLLQNGIADNPHGWGIMRARKDQILIDKGTDPASFWAAFSKVGRGACAIHFRLATHGRTDVSNCHPFSLCNNRYALMHNGIISSAVIDRDRSDTWHFAHYVLEPILTARPELFGSEALSDMLGAIIGSGNKLVILRADGASMVVNRKSGGDHEGLWLSNTHSLPGRSRWSKWDVRGASDAIGSRSLSAWRDREYDRDDYATAYSASDLAGAIPIETTETDDDAPAVPDRDQFYTISDLAGLNYGDILEWVCKDPESAADLLWSESGGY